MNPDLQAPAPEHGVWEEGSWGLGPCLVSLQEEMEEEAQEVT